MTAGFPNAIGRFSKLRGAASVFQPLLELLDLV
jgi:hypothetical protein